MRRVILIGLALAVAGCDSDSGKVVVHPVSGQVLYDGKPAVGVQVYLFPTTAPAVPAIPMNPHGVTGPDGRFTLGTFAETDGAAEGGYQVILFWPDETSTEKEHDVDRLLGWYTAGRSRITVTIKAGSNDLPTWKLPPMKIAPPEGGGGIPGRN